MWVDMLPETQLPRARRPESGVGAAGRNAWVVTTPSLRPGVRLRLFCLPYAGGGAAVFRGWQAGLPSAVEVCPVRLPGREMRLKEPAITEMPVMLHRLGEALTPYLGQPYAFFGHSMGALLAYELLDRLARAGRPLPAYLFVSGRQAPHVERAPLSQPVERLSDADFLRDLAPVNAGSRAAVDHPDLAALVLPVLRADFLLCQSYRAVRRPPFALPLTALGGLDDPAVDRAALEPWAEHTTRSFSLHMFPGDHMFVHSAAAQVQRMVSEKLAAIL